MRQLHFLALLLLPGERSGGSTVSCWWQSCCQLPSSPLSSLPPSLSSGSLVSVLTTTTQASPTIPTTALLVQTASTVLSATGKNLLIYTKLILVKFQFLSFKLVVYCLPQVWHPQLWDQRQLPLLPKMQELCVNWLLWWRLWDQKPPEKNPPLWSDLLSWFSDCWFYNKF